MDRGNDNGKVKKHALITNLMVKYKDSEELAKSFLPVK